MMLLALTALMLGGLLVLLSVWPTGRFGRHAGS